MWQFGLGAMVALVPALRIRNAIGSFVLGWAGIVVLLIVDLPLRRPDAVPRLHGRDPDAGRGRRDRGVQHRAVVVPDTLLAIRPAQFVGNISYSLYLWHWPLIIIAPSVPFWGLTIYHRVALLLICFVLAWLTKRFVEDPARGWKVLTSRPARVTLWSSLAAMLMVAGTAGIAWAVNAPAYTEGRAGDPGAAREPARLLRRGDRARRRMRGHGLRRHDPARAGLRGRGSADRRTVLRAAQRRTTRLVRVRLGRRRRPAGRADRRQPCVPAAVDVPADGRGERLAPHDVLQGRVPVEHHPAVHARCVRRGLHAVAQRRDVRSRRRRPRRRLHGRDRDDAVLIGGL